MSEHIDEQISEFIDNEMSAEECEFFVRRLERDGEARKRYLRYQLIGAAVRGEHVYASTAGLRQRLSRVLDGAEAARRGAAFGWLTGTRAAAGIGIAASVALVAVFGLRFLSLGPPDAADRAGEIAANDAQSYVVPTATVEPQPLVPLGAEVAGIQYLIHHTGYSSGFNRTIMRSGFVAGPDAEAADDSEGTD